MTWVLQPARHTKLEKADILEMTVRHLQSLHRSGGGGQHSSVPTAATQGPTVDASPSSAALTAVVVQKFQTGYQECAGEVNRFVGRLDGVDDDIKKRLMSHLDSCVAKMRYLAPPPHVHNYTSQQQQHIEQVAAALMPGTAGRPHMLPDLALVPSSVPLPPPPQPPPPQPVGRLRTSAFTAVHGSSPPDTGHRSPYGVFCDEPAVSSTSSWAEDVAAAAEATSVTGRSPPLDFSMKKPVAACIGKRPLGDISVNVPTAAASSSHKTAVSAFGGHRATAAIDGPAAAAPAARPCDDPGADPNMWRPW